MLLTGVLIFSLLFKNISCFNIDTNFPIVYTDPSKYLHLNSSKTSYFGYSLVLYPGNRKNAPWILIGAPRAASPTTKIKNPGVCFKCGIRESCAIQQIRELSGVLENNQIEKLDNAWIGGSMDINYKYERVVMCAYRWINVIKKRYSDDYYMRGSCYWFHIDDKSNTTQRLTPLLEEGGDKDTYKDGTYVYYYAQGQAGFSVHMPPNEKQLLLGAPGVYNWDGTPIVYRDRNDSSPEASRLHKTRKRYASPNDFGYKNVANTIKTTETVAYDLLGYSSTSGYFYGKNQLYYVSGAPRSDNYRGQVLIYKFDVIGDRPLMVRETRRGDQFGEYFGSVVVAGDINSDGYDDLIVGAPFHKAINYNEGKIYVFISNFKRLSVNPTVVVGKSTNGQFGTSLQYLGDINSDGFGDLAVAAPFEEEKSGVVYIYRGTKTGLETTYSQRIVGKDISSEIRGFGISISRPADIDYNKYSDIAIGAHLSGHVVVLRTRPTVTVYHELKSSLPRLDYKEKSFEIETCFWYTLNQNDVSFSIRRIITVDEQLGRAKLGDNNYADVIEFQNNNNRNCQNFRVILEESFLNKYDPITIGLAHEFISKNETKQVTYVSENVSGDDSFCPRCPIYDKYGSSLPVTRNIPFALNCGSDNICSASVEVTSTLTGTDDDGSFLLGSKPYLQLRTVVKNLGENAYLTQLLVTLPEIVTFQRTPSACAEQNTSSVLCSVDNPLETDREKMITLDLDMTNVNSGKYDDSLVFTITLLTSSENDRENVKYLTVKLKREADLIITGKSGEQSYSYKDISQGLPNFTQIYQVESFGSSPLNEILVEIDIPHAFQTKEDNIINFISLYPLGGKILNREITCTSNFSYINDLEDDTSVLDEENSVLTEQTKRTKRQVEAFNNSDIVKENIIQTNEFDKLQNRTFYINCSVPEVLCSKIFCKTGPIKSSDIADVRVKMLFNVTAIKNLLNKKDVILFTTRGSVTVINPSNFEQSGNKPDVTDVSSLFFGDSIEEGIQYWIIIVSVVAGLLLLLVLVLGLVKAGFFKRSRKEELEQLKKEMETQQTDALNAEEQEL